MLGVSLFLLLCTADDPSECLHFVHIYSAYHRYFTINALTMYSAQFGLELREKHAEDRCVAAFIARITAGDDPSLNPPFDPINPWNYIVIGRSKSTQPPPPSPNYAIPISNPWYIDDVIPACEIGRASCRERV